MTYTTESDIEAMAEAMHRALHATFPNNGTSDAFEGRALNSTISAWMDVAVKAALAASPVHAELARVKVENERLMGALTKAHDRLQQDAMGAECATQRRLNTLAIIKQALQQKGGGDE